MQCKYECEYGLEIIVVIRIILIPSASLKKAELLMGLTIMSNHFVFVEK